MRVFHMSFSWWFFTWVWVTASHLRILLSILAVLSDAVVWMVSTHPLISNSSSPFNNPLVTIPKASITIRIIVTFMFHSFFNSLARSRYLSFFLRSFSFIPWSSGTAKPIILQVLFFIVYHKVWTDAALCIYHLFVWSNLNFLKISQRITLPNQLCQVLYSFYANLLHSLSMWLMVSSLLPYNNNNNYYYYYLLFVLFSSSLADGFSLESDWDQITWILLDSSRYSGRSQECSSFDGLHSSSYFQLLHSL